AGGAGLDVEVLGEVGAQPAELAVRVAVEPAGGLGDGVGDVADDLLRGWVRVLVDIEQHGHVELRCAVGGESGEVGPDGKGGHGHVLQSTATGVGRSPASAHA